MENPGWWAPHLWIIALQAVACVGYILGSHRFYNYRDKFFFPIIMGILFDVIVTVTASSGILPRMEACQGVPWQSWLFMIHIVTACLGMFGFIILVIYIIAKGKKNQYKKLRVFQYKVLLPLWCFGVFIALVNFIVKLAFGIRLYDYI